MELVPSPWISVCKGSSPFLWAGLAVGSVIHSSACRAPFPFASFLPASWGGGVCHGAFLLSDCQHTQVAQVEARGADPGALRPAHLPQRARQLNWQSWREASRESIYRANQLVNGSTQGTAVVGIFLHCEQENSGCPVFLPRGRDSGERTD